MSHPPPGQPWYPGQPDPNQPQYGAGYPGGQPAGAGPSWPDQAQPYSGGPAYPQQPGYGDPAYGAQPHSGGPAYPPAESYTTEPPYSGQPYSGQPYSGPPYQQTQAPGYDQGYQQPAAYPQPRYPQPVQLPQSPPPTRSRAGLIALVASAGVLVLLVCVIGGVVLLRTGNGENRTTTQPSGQPSTQPSAQPSRSGKAEYPATIILPDNVAGMPKLNNADLNKTANDTALKIKNATNADSAVAGYYAPGGDVTKAVGIVGATARIADPAAELKSAFSSALTVTDLQDEEPGPLGGVVQCGNTSSGGSALTICGWADGGSLALGIFLNRSLTDSATLFRTIRGEVLRRG